MSRENTKKVELLLFLIRPVVRFALRHGIKFQETSQLVKYCFIEEAKRALEISNQKVNASRLSVATGLQRRELEKNEKLDLENGKVGLISKVIGHWSLSEEFTDTNGQAKILTCNGADSEFVKLVKAVSKDLHPGTLMFELERLGLINKHENHVSLASKIIDLGNDPLEAFKLLSQNSNDLISTVEKNIFDKEIISKKSVPNLHAATEFTKIDLNKIDNVKNWLLHEGSAFHKRAREHIAKYDLDLNQGKDEDRNEGARVCLVTFSIVDTEVK